jgi:peptidoglycan/LPS O-acetylase OafA/YrhL
MKQKLNFDILESIRGLASLYVCIGHCRAICWIGGTHYRQLHQNGLATTDYIVLGMNMLTRLTSEFVIVFFVLSGFSIAHSLRNSTSPAPFYKRRFIRLYPPYVTALLWAVFVFLLIRSLAPYLVNGTYHTENFDRLVASEKLISWKGLLRNLFYIPQLDGILGPFWSLTQEVIFYLLAPFLFRSKKMYYVVSAVLFLIAGVCTQMHWQENTIIINFFHYNIFFAAGVGLYNYFEKIANKSQVFSRSRTFWASIMIFFVMVAISSYNHGGDNLYLTMLNEFIAAFLSVILIICLLSNNVKIKPLIALGRFSYTLYITHYASVYLYMALYFVITSATPPYIFNNWVFIPCVFFCLFIAFLHYSLVEKKTKFFLNRLRKKVEDKPASSVPYPLTEEEIKK